MARGSTPWPRARVVGVCAAAWPGAPGLPEVCAGPGAAAPDRGGEREWPGDWVSLRPWNGGEDVLPRRTLDFEKSEPLWTGFKSQQGTWG